MVLMDLYWVDLRAGQSRKKWLVAFKDGGEQGQNVFHLRLATLSWEVIRGDNSVGIFAKRVPSQP